MSYGADIADAMIELDRLLKEYEHLAFPPLKKKGKYGLVEQMRRKSFRKMKDAIEHMMVVAIGNEFDSVEEALHFRDYCEPCKGSGWAEDGEEGGDPCSVCQGRGR